MLQIEDDITTVVTLSLRRHLGNEYINHYNETMLHVLRCNHDVRLLIGSADEIYYALKYALKYQHDTDELAATCLAASEKG